MNERNICEPGSASSQLGVAFPWGTCASVTSQGLKGAGHVPCAVCQSEPDIVQ